MFNVDYFTKEAIKNLIQTGQNFVTIHTEY